METDSEVNKKCAISCICSLYAFPHPSQKSWGALLTRLFFAYLLAWPALGYPTSTPSIPARSISFSDLSVDQADPSPIHDRFIQIKGFWHPLSAQEGVLSPYPHLKSCCLSSPQTVAHRIMVTGQVGPLSTDRAIMLQGLLSIQPLYNAQGQLIQYYVLKEARAVPPTRTGSWIALLLSLLLAAAWLLFYRTR